MPNTRILDEGRTIRCWSGHGTIIAARRKGGLAYKDPTKVEVLLKPKDAADFLELIGEQYADEAADEQRRKIARKMARKEFGKKALCALVVEVDQFLNFVEKLNPRVARELRRDEERYAATLVAAA